MLGLDAAGKTTILYKLHIGEVLSTVPTLGEWIRDVSREISPRPRPARRSPRGANGTRTRSSTWR